MTVLLYLRLLSIPIIHFYYPAAPNKGPSLVGEKWHVR
ncbi:unnamed protein product [Larinioides sclopetarius]|uniref:Uncharacterized protein n=1 Tax=Larinioides sclopetarius TaxID=280406 RepID=A0AAV1ZX46_9ARAC